MSGRQTVGGFRLAHAAAPDWRVAVNRCLAALEPLPAGANLGFVYFTDHFVKDTGEILKALRAGLGVDALVGTTGYGICATGQEYFDTPALAVLVGSMPADSFRVFDRPDRRPQGWFGVVHADPRTPALPELLGDLAEASGSFIVGGLSASRSAMPQLAGSVTGGSISGVMFSDAVEVLTGLTQSCMPIGPAHRITAAEGNVIEALDDRPALEVFKAEIGETAARNLGRLGGTIMAALPVSGADRPDYLVRNLTGIDPARKLIAIGALVEEGESIMFCRRDAEAAAADLDRMLDDLKRRAGGRTPRGALYFSCNARGPNMFGGDSQELKRVRDRIGDVPLAGLFCNGEISNARLYGYTGVLTLFM